MITHHLRLSAMATMLIVFGTPWQDKGESGQQSSADKLVSAIWAHDSNTIHSILAKGVDLNSRDVNGTTPLIESIGHHPELAKELVTNGADPNFPADDGSSPLMHAAWNCQLELARFLLDRGARLDARDRDGETALMYAALTCSDGRMVHLLLEAGAAVNDSGKMGETPLMIAAKSGDLEAVKALVAAGADLNAADEDGETALTLAQEATFKKKAHKRVYNYLLQVSKEASRRQVAPR